MKIEALCPNCCTRFELQIPSSAQVILCPLCGSPVGSCSDGYASSIDISELSSSAVFVQPIDSWVNNKTAQIIDAANRAIFEAARVRDERALALVGAMVIEHEIDAFLSTILPRYKALEEQRDFSFSVKIELARSFDLCPSRFFNDANLVRKIRNEFAHKLSIKAFSEINSGLRESVRSRLGSYGVTPQASDRDSFCNLLTNLAMALRVYQVHVARLSEFIRSKECIELIKERTQAGTFPNGGA